MIQKIKSFISPAINFIFPPVCASCKEKLENPETPICDACWNGLEPDDMDPVDPEKKGFAFSEIRAVWKFSETFQSIIHFLKYDHKKSVGRKLGRLLAERIPDEYFKDMDCIVPVPVHHTRRRERGYNQAEIIGEALAEKVGLPMDKKVLKRLRKTTTQTKLSKRIRGKNISGAFMAEGDLSGKRILLLDDVFTTGSTVNECSKALLAAGAAEVRVLTAARA
jgi:ComF family protein